MNFFLDYKTCVYKNGNCAFGCRNVTHNRTVGQPNYTVLQCNACSNGYYLDLKDGKCTSCLVGNKFAGLYCAQESDSAVRVKHNDEFLMNCENGYTMDKNLSKFSIFF